jgi:hypothetical protein
MWATDSPYQAYPPGYPAGEMVLGSYEASLALVRDDVVMTDEQREWMLRKTAEKVYFGGASLQPASKL